MENNQFLRKKVAKGKKNIDKKNWKIKSSVIDFPHPQIDVALLPEMNVIFPSHPSHHIIRNDIWNPSKKLKYITIVFKPRLGMSIIHGNHCGILYIYTTCRHRHDSFKPPSVPSQSTKSMGTWRRSWVYTSIVASPSGSGMRRDDGRRQRCRMYKIN